MSAQTQTTTDPVRRTITVNKSVPEAFALFTGRIAAWWPLAAQSTTPGTGATTTPVLEPRLGGRLYERAEDGTVTNWGEVLVWEPPHRLLLAWQPTPDTPATEVEIGFTPEGAGTRVELEHRGWERLGGQAAVARDRYSAHWEGVLRLYAAGGHENGHAIAALVLGISSIVVPVLGLLAAPFGIVFGVLGKRRARRGARQGGLATAGLTLAVIGLVLWGVLMIGGAAVVMTGGPSDGQDQSVPVGSIGENHPPADELP